MPSILVLSGAAESSCLGALRKSLIGWIIIFAVGITWETLGIFGVDGVWPLTWLVRDAMNHSEVAVALVCGLLAWLAYHFLVEPRKYN